MSASTMAQTVTGLRDEMFVAQTDRKIRDAQPDGRRGSRNDVASGGILEMNSFFVEWCGAACKHGDDSFIY